MKKLLFILFAAPLLAGAQQSYTLTGKFSGLNVPAKVYLATFNGTGYSETDSAEVKNGQFKLTGRVDEPQPAIIAMRRSGAGTSKNPRDYQSFFLENSPITFTGVDSITHATVSGSVADRESREVDALVKPLTNRIIKLQNEYGKKGADGAFLKTLEARKLAGDSVQMLVAEIKNVRRQFVESHLNSFMGLYTYYLHVLDSKFDPAVVEPLFQRFSAALKASPLGQRTVEKIEIGRRRQAGAKATDFTQNDVDGKPFTLSSLRGKYVLVDFWASWCIPCRAENPNVVKAYNALKNNNFEIVSVSLDAGKEAWVEAIKKDGMPWIHVSDLKYWKNEVAILYGINSVPQNILVDPKGMIIAKNLRGENLLEQLKVYIK